MSTVGNMMPKNNLTEAGMFDQILHEMHYIRSRLDEHVDDEEKSFNEIRRDISKIREDMAIHKTRMGVISSGVAAIVAGFVAWVSTHVGK